MANFGILQPIQAGGAVGSLPATPAGPGVGDAIGGLLNGFMKGAQQGQDMEAQKLNMASKQQEMDFNKQNNPLILEQNKQKVQGGAIDLKTKEEAYAYSQKIQEAAKQGEQQYLQVLPPDQRIKYLTDKAQYNKVIAETVKLGAEANKLGAEGQKQAIMNAYIIQDSIGAANSSALQFQDPKQQEAAYNQVKQTLPPDIQKLMTPNFDPTFAPIAVTVGTQAHAKYIETQFANKGKSSTSLQKNLQRQGELESKAKSGQLNPEEQTELKGLTAANQASGRGFTPNVLDSEVAKVDAKKVEQLSTLRDNMKTFFMDSQEVEKQLPNVPDWSTGPIAKNLKIDKLSPETQKIISPLNAMALQLKEYYKLGSGQGFTDADRDFLTEIAGNTGFYKYSISEINKRMQGLAVKAQHNSWEQEKNIRKRGTPDNFNQWLESNPEPAKTLQEYKKQNPIDSNSTFTEGKVYQDASGNKARYINGKWESL